MECVVSWVGRLAPVTDSTLTCRLSAVTSRGFLGFCVARPRRHLNRIETSANRKKPNWRDSPWDLKTGAPLIP